MNIETIKSVYFVGAGGIGMSALVRYFLFKGKVVAGYDRTPTPLTEALIAEGAQIHYEENVDLIPEACKDKESTLVVFTPAVPQEHEELVYFRNNGFEIQKRAQVLGTITHSSKGLCVAGTHGKTTTSTMTAHLLHQSHVECTAFLGGISKNYGTNLLLSQKSPYTVIEADEFDRSFHWLSPFMSVITATDPDHLDIYGTEAAYLESFEHYTTLIQPGGALIIRKGISLQPKVQPGVRVYTYSRDEGDFHAENIRIGNGEIFIDFVAPDTRINDIQLGVPVSINIENGVAAMALAHLNGVTDEEIKRGMASFRGVDRRFDFKIKNDRIVFLSDYAHHPSEINLKKISLFRRLRAQAPYNSAFPPVQHTVAGGAVTDSPAQKLTLPGNFFCAGNAGGQNHCFRLDHLTVHIQKKIFSHRKNIGCLPFFRNHSHRPGVAEKLFHHLPAVYIIQAKIIVYFFCP